ncbi:MAG: hypothetical protein QW335_05675 [Candidatus Nezhaarchaeales archaeon]
MVFKKTMLAILVLYLITFLHGSSYAITSQESYSDGSEKSFWSFGVPRVLDWSDYGLAVGTSTGHLLVYDHHGSLRWERRLNYTSTWDVSWSDSGELAVVSLGPPGVLYVFNHDGALLWSMESEHQANSVAWSGDMIAVGADSLMVFDKSGKLLWIHDPLNIFSGAKLIKVGEALEVPLGYLVDLGNRTRLVLKSYKHTSKNEITLNWGRQYYISATSDYGVVEGIGWYNEGDEARITISPTKFEKDTKTYTFQGWEEDGALVSTSPTYIFKVQSPTTLKAKWTVEGLAIPTELFINVIIGALIAITIALVTMLTRRRRDHQLTYTSLLHVEP